MALPSINSIKYEPQSMPSVEEPPAPDVIPPEMKRTTARPFLVALPMGLQEWAVSKRPDYD